MKFKKDISVLIALMFISVLVSCDSKQNRIQEPFRLNTPRIAPLTESQWNEEQIKVLSQYKREDGSILNVLSTIGRHPILLDRYSPFITYIMGEQTLPDRDREILILRIGWLFKAKYEFGHHSIFGKNAGLTDEEILRITKGAEAPGWSISEAALIQATDELYNDAIISDATWTTLSANFTEEQLIDVIFTVGQYNMVSWALNSLGVQLEEGIPGFPEDL
jgi:alkylhydroperoxidase family enzyme